MYAAGCGRGLGKGGGATPVPANGGGGGDGGTVAVANRAGGAGAPIAGARKVVKPAPSVAPGSAARAVIWRVTTLPIISVAVTVTFASSAGACEHPNTVQPPFSAKQSA